MLKIHRFVSILFFIHLFLTVHAKINPIVETEYGPIEGFNYVTPEGIEIEIFLGIPYAKPPINELRFEKPQPPIPWTTKPLQAKFLGLPCATSPDLMSPNGIEDCLTMNIVKPKIQSNNSEGYPIMLWIHGGGFISGSSADYNHTEVANRMVSKGEIIFVSINYRLGPFGFFSTGDSNAPGNYGLWDQVEALKFIQKIISNFNGNPKSVTIFGESAGGASVSWLTLSPATDGLFNRAIAMSGSAIAGWAHTDEVPEASQLLIEAANCNLASNVKECLKTKTMQEIKNATLRFAKYIFNCDHVNLAHFHPRHDGMFLHGANFDDAFRNAPKREIFMGLCSQEHITFAITSKYSGSESKYIPIPEAKAANYSRTDFIDLVHFLFGVKHAFGINSPSAVQRIIEFYESQNSYQRNFYLQIYTQLFSDVNFNIPAIREAKKKAAAGHKVYFYLYNFVPKKHNLLDGAPHTSELSNFFGSIFGVPSLPFEGDVAKVQKTLVDLFLNFAKNGKPLTNNFEIPHIDHDSPNIIYLEINSENKIMDNLWNDRMEFWNSLADEYGYDWPEARRIKKSEKF